MQPNYLKTSVVKYKIKYMQRLVLIYVLFLLLSFSLAAQNTIEVKPDTIIYNENQKPALILYDSTTVDSLGKDNTLLFVPPDKNKIDAFSQAESNLKKEKSLFLKIILFLIPVVVLGIWLLLHKKRNSNLKSILTKQERVIVELINSDKTNKQIAEELFISISTVKTHINNIYRKLNISNRDELKK